MKTTNLQHNTSRDASNAADRMLFRMYDLLWRLATPALRLNRRLSDGFSQRTLIDFPLKKSDIWIQAASAGEAYLCWSILQNIRLPAGSHVLMTSNTRQGIDILENAAEDARKNQNNITYTIACFPFDRPGSMKKAVEKVQPGLLVLLETEIWPGLLMATSEGGYKSIIVNGRVTPRSLDRYRLRPTIWPMLAPDRILAISEEDAQRFRRLFGNTEVEVMSNIKFDRADTNLQTLPDNHPLMSLIDEKKPFIILGSVRKEEEEVIEKIILEILKRLPDCVIGLFPRHMHRLQHWKTTLDRRSVPWRLRSCAADTINRQCVLLWDTFGELGAAYSMASAVFVGGSLAPLGGQNFLEPLMCGIKPVIGPHWKNFSWVGDEIFRKGLVRKVENWRQVASLMIKDAESPAPGDTVRIEARSYIQRRQGGTDSACRAIEKMLLNS